MTSAAAREERAGGYYVKVVCYDSSVGRQSSRLSFIVSRPEHEPGFQLERQAGPDRQIRYTIRAYTTNTPTGERYSRNGASNGSPS